MVQFSTLRYEHVLQITASVYNNRPHSGLYGETPISAHFNSYVSSKIARKNEARRTDRQADLRTVFSTKPSNIFAPGDRVLLKSKKHQFHKYSPLFYPTFAPGVFTVTSADFKVFPALYRLSGVDPARSFYGWELLKLDKSFDRTAERQKRRANLNRDHILVQDVTLSEPTRLRSGRIVNKDKAQVLYRISRHGKTDIVDQPGLRIWKKALPDGAIQYSEEFSEPSWKSQYRL